jgi:hypothetical protein
MNKHDRSAAVLFGHPQISHRRKSVDMGGQQQTLPSDFSTVIGTAYGAEGIYRRCGSCSRVVIVSGLVSSHAIDVLLYRAVAVRFWWQAAKRGEGGGMNDGFGLWRKLNG